MDDYTFQDVNGFGMGASPDGLGLPPLGATVEVIQENPVSPVRRTLAVAYALASVAGAGLGAYHGYKRNDSWGWALGWSLLGSLLPIVVIPVAFAQGLGQRKRGR